jgi:hypothetical protein
MANIDDYNARLGEIQAIPDEETRGPDIPVDVALQEAENLHHWSLDDAVALAVVGITTDIAVLGRENPEPLTAIGFDLTQLDLAATRADELANLLAEANADKADPNESKIIRDKAYTHMKALVDEIREAGKYVFRNNKNRLKGYSSDYWRKLHRKQSSNQDDVA